MNELSQNAQIIITALAFPGFMAFIVLMALAEEATNKAIGWVKGLSKA